MESTKKYVEVYAESTPNPAAMKFVVNRILLNEGVVEYFKKEDAVNCPLAFQLFDFTGVKAVFITSNFITITKTSDIDWYDILAILREFIKGFFMGDEKLFLKNPFEEQQAPATRNHDNEIGNEKIESADNAQLEQQIIQMLEEYVRPAVEQDGGAIHFKSFDNGVVTLILKGSCSGCPSSTLTLKSGIENLLKKMVPQVTEVVAEEG
ncbi:MAG TPA: NifU family protein [Bacteroidia bacterium]|nr:NifU family protein [Bacteroidia bacterium]